MIYQTQAVRQGINATNHAVAKMVVISTSLTFLSLAFIAFGGV
jgi:hypothetical protein